MTASGHHFVVGCSLGLKGSRDPTAIAVVEQVGTGYGKAPRIVELRLRHLERLALDVGFPQAVEHANRLLARLEPMEESERGAELVLDLTGVGNAPLALFEQAGLRPITVRLTGGSGEEEVEANRWHIAKVDLIGGLVLGFQTNHVRIAGGLELADDLQRELAEFSFKPPVVNPNDPEAWREGAQDDLVFAVALATWQAKRWIPVPRRVQERWDKEARRKRRHHSQWAY